MSDIVLEIIRAIIVSVIFLYLLIIGRKEEIRRQKGWLYILFGFGLILFGMFIDITDNFPSLNHFIIIGDTKYQAFLEKVVGYLFGFILLAFGFWKWMPTIIRLRITERNLKKSHDELELRVEERTLELREKIKERQHAEEALRESEERFRQTVELLPSIVCEYDINGRFTYVNSYGLETFSYTHADLEQGLFATDLFPPDELERFKDRFGMLLKGEAPEPSEYRLQTKDGLTIYVIANSAPIYKDGKIVGLRSSVTPITERKQVEEALKISEQKYRELSDLLPQIVFETDKYGNVTFVNRIAFDLFGYTRDDLKRGVNALQMLIPEDRDRAKKNIAIILRGEVLGGNEYTAMRKDGSTYPVLIYSSPIISEGEPVGLRGIMADLTEIKKAEESLKESEKKYRTVLEANPDPVVVYDMEGKVVYFNPAFTGVFGWTLEERFGKTMDVFVPDEAWSKTKMMINKVLAGKSFSGVETCRYTKEGNIIDVSISGAIYKDQDGNPAGSIINLRDISDQKRMEAQLQRAQKMEALGILAGGVAHDLNNVLSGIVTLPDLLLMQIPEDSPLKKSILTMQSSGKKAAEIVQDLLTLARRGIVSEEVVNLNEIISEYLNNPEHKKLKSFHPGVEVETILESDLFNISGSPVHLSKAVMNLVSNAAEAMPHGGKISICTENRYIDRPISGYDSIEEGDYITFTVADTGIGISSEDIKRIFEPFYTKKIMGKSGSGLGMAVVWSTVKDHKGYIDIQSTEGKGTKLTLYFPSTGRARADEKDILPIENYKGQGESILVVDDVREQREILFNLLATLGYEVNTVSSGEEAVEYLKDNDADLIILDMIMDPGIDGLETYRKILQVHPNQKAIIASGFSETDRVKEAQRLGAGQYIKKPYTLGKIGIAVKDALFENHDLA